MKTNLPRAKDFIFESIEDVNRELGHTFIVTRHPSETDKAEVMFIYGGVLHKLTIILRKVYFFKTRKHKLGIRASEYVFNYLKEYDKKTPAFNIKK